MLTQLSTMSEPPLHPFANTQPVNACKKLVPDELLDFDYEKEHLLFVQLELHPKPKNGDDANKLYSVAYETRTKDDDLCD